MKNAGYLLALVIVAVTVSTAGVDRACAELIDFEPPKNVNGAKPSAPWVDEYPGQSYMAVSNANPLAGTQSLDIYNNIWPYMPMSISASGSVTISCKMRLPSYNPGAYDPGYMNMGQFSVYGTGANRNEASLKFELSKPYEDLLLDEHRQIIDKRDDSVIGYYVDGGVYDITYVFDWTAGTLTYNLLCGDQEINKTYYSITANDLDQLTLGGNLLADINGGITTYDNIVIPEPFTVALLGAGAIGMVLSKKPGKPSKK